MRAFPITQRLTGGLAARLCLTALLAVTLTGCMESAPMGLAPGLVARMDAPGATLDTAQAINIINQYRATRNAPALTFAPQLGASAAALARQYAVSGTPPTLPAGATAIRISAGYPNFAETFSGWRNSPADATVLAGANARHAGVAAYHDPNSAYGIYWVLLLAS